MEIQTVIPANQHSLHSVLHLPQHNPTAKLPVVVICHGFISSKVGQHRLFVKVARQLCQAGFAVLRFDFSGCGESSGEYREVTLPQQLAETKAILDFVASHPNIDHQRIILLGHSLGGCIAATIAGRDARVNTLILWSPVANPFKDIVDIVGAEIYKDCLQNGTANYQGFELGRDFFASLSQVQPIDAVKGFSGHVLVLHGSADADTPLENAQMYRNALAIRTENIPDIKIIDGADHTYSSPLWEKELIGQTLQWLNLNKL